MIELEHVILRPVEHTDLPNLYEFRNDAEVVRHLSGYSAGYSNADLVDWLDRHRKRSDEVLWAIAEKGQNRCIGHVGLYQIDARVRKAEFAIVVGDRGFQGKRIGKAASKAVVGYGFEELNLHPHLFAGPRVERARDPPVPGPRLPRRGCAPARPVPRRSVRGRPPHVRLGRGMAALTERRLDARWEVGLEFDWSDEWSNGAAPAEWPTRWTYFATDRGVLLALGRLLEGPRRLHLPSFSVPGHAIALPGIRALALPRPSVRARPKSVHCGRSPRTSSSRSTSSGCAPRERHRELEQGRSRTKIDPALPDQSEAHGRLPPARAPLPHALLPQGVGDLDAEQIGAACHRPRRGVGRRCRSAAPRSPA